MSVTGHGCFGVLVGWFVGLLVGWWVGIFMNN
jgi:acid phosphatase family membrane protein YuiD